MTTTLHTRRALLPTGWATDARVTVHAGRIASIETGAAPEPDDQRAHNLIPGMPNLHSHAFQRAMAGLTEVPGPADDTF